MRNIQSFDSQGRMLRVDSAATEIGRAEDRADCWQPHNAPQAAGTNIGDPGLGVSAPQGGLPGKNMPQPPAPGPAASDWQRGDQLVGGGGRR